MGIRFEDRSVIIDKCFEHEEFTQFITYLKGEEFVNSEFLEIVLIDVDSLDYPVRMVEYIKPLLTEMEVWVDVIGSVSKHTIVFLELANNPILIDEFSRLEVAHKPPFDPNLKLSDHYLYNGPFGELFKEFLTNFLSDKYLSELERSRPENKDSTYVLFNKDVLFSLSGEEIIEGFPKLEFEVRGVCSNT